MSLLPFFEWCYQTSMGEEIRNSLWLFPILEAFHLLGFGIIAGTVLVVDLRLLGVVLEKQPVAQLSADVEPWMLASVAVMFLSGIPLFLCEAIKCFYSIPFWVKMISLFLALLFTFTFRRRVIWSGKTPLDRVTAYISLALWFSVAWGGRWIGFS